MLNTMVNCWLAWSERDQNSTELINIAPHRECDFTKTLDTMISLAKHDGKNQLATLYEELRESRTFNWYDRKTLAFKEIRPEWLVNPSPLSSSMEKSATFLYEARNNDQEYYIRWIYLIASQLIDKLDKSAFKNILGMEDALAGLVDECRKASRSVTVFDSVKRNHRNRLLPYGPIYNAKDFSAIGDTINEYLLSFIFFAEMQYILANFEMRETTV